MNSNEMSYSGEERRNKRDPDTTIELLVGKMTNIISVVDSLKNETTQTIKAEVSSVRNDLVTLRSDMEQLNQQLQHDVENLSTNIVHLEVKGVSAAQSIKTNNEKEHSNFMKAIINIRKDFHERISNNENDDYKFMSETRERFSKVDRRLDETNEKLEELKHKPTVQSAQNWDKLKAQILWSTITFLLTVSGMWLWNQFQQMMKTVGGS